MAGPKPTVIDARVLAGMPLPAPGADGSKADRGKLLLVAGSRALPGAAILAGRAALRVGCGTVRVAAPRSAALAIGAAVPELMVVELPETGRGTTSADAFAALEAQFGPCDAAVIGPGTGADEQTDRLAARFVGATPLPTVVDAHAMLAWGEAGRPVGPGPLIVTPHVGEMARLTGLGEDEVERDREALATRCARDWGVVVVLKGRRTLIAGREAYVNTAGTRGLGTAGSGDVLAGVIGGLLARGADPLVAAAWGVQLHALAGEVAAEARGDDGMIASDVVDCLPAALRRLQGRSSS